MNRREIKDDRVAWVMAYLDERGATFEAVAGTPSRFAAVYTMPNGEAKRWACSDATEDVEQAFAQAFRVRVERSEKAFARPMDAYFQPRPKASA